MTVEITADGIKGVGSLFLIRAAVAKLKFIRSANKWRLYWQRADLKWHEYPGRSSSDRLDELVREIDDDPLACCFG